MKANQKGFSPNIILAKAKYFLLYFPRPEGQGYCMIWVQKITTSSNGRAVIRFLLIEFIIKQKTAKASSKGVDQYNPSQT